MNKQIELKVGQWVNIRHVKGPRKIEFIRPNGVLVIEKMDFFIRPDAVKPAHKKPIREVIEAINRSSKQTVLSDLIEKMGWTIDEVLYESSTLRS